MSSEQVDPVIPSAVPPSPSTTKPFRFKTKPRRSSSHRNRSASPIETHPSSHRRYHRHHHRSHRRPYTPPPDPTHYDSTYIPNPQSNQYLHPDTAFRESLFDALADDEGAAFWEGVYGQPIHTYSPYTAKADLTDDDPENPKLERMSDEEYVSYVRGKMWEKSHGYIIEERRRRDEDRKRKRERDVRGEEEARRWHAGVEDALRRGEERRKRARWKGVWGRYVDGWENVFAEDKEVGREKRPIREHIHWPVESGKLSDVGTEEIERFFRQAPRAARGVKEGEVDLADVLKKERVRWHPDKMQQKAGSEGLDEGTVKVVTAVFQIIDRLWSELKDKA